MVLQFPCYRQLDVHGCDVNELSISLGLPSKPLHFNVDKHLVPPLLFSPALSCPEAELSRIQTSLTDRKQQNLTMIALPDAHHPPPTVMYSYYR